MVVGTDGSLSGTPALSDAGTNVFTVGVDDGKGGSDTATLNITVLDQADFDIHEAEDAVHMIRQRAPIRGAIRVRAMWS